MKLIHTDNNGDEHAVAIGYCFGQGSDELEVTWCPKPHKSSSSGKVTVRSTIPDRDEPSEYFCHVFDMKWIEREDQGWIDPEIELRNVINIYEDLYDDYLSGLNIASIVDMIQQVDLEHLSKHPEYAVILLNWLEKHNLPEMLKPQNQ